MILQHFESNKDTAMSNANNQHRIQINLQCPNSNNMVVDERSQRRASLTDLNLKSLFSIFFFLFSRKNYASVVFETQDRAENGNL